MLQAVIFDLDGTLVDSESLNRSVNEELFNEVGLALTESDYDSFVGLSNKDLWKYLIDRYGLDVTVEEMVQRKKEKILPLWREKDRYGLMEGAVEFLHELQAQNIPLGLATSSMEDSMHAKLKAHDLDQFFQQKVSGDHVLKGKPDPEIFLLTADKMGVDPASCVVIEDAENGVLAAKNAGMKVVGYTNGGKNMQNLERADLVIDRFDELSIDMLGALWRT